MLRIAITGGIACGKSKVAEFFAAEGVATNDADTLAHGIMGPGTPVFRRVTAAFGRRALDSSGRIDRKKLGDIVFSDPAELRILNAIVHPHVAGAWNAWLESVEKGKAKAAAVTIPLLFEANTEKGWDAVVCVTANRSVQIERLVARGLTIKKANDRIESQIPVSRKMALSDFVIVNNGSEQVLKEQSLYVLEDITRVNKRQAKEQNEKTKVWQRCPKRRKTSE